MRKPERKEDGWGIPKKSAGGVKNHSKWTFEIASRSGGEEIWGIWKGSRDKVNKAAKNWLEDTLDQVTSVRYRYHAKLKSDIFEFILPDGKGRRWNGRFNHFFGLME